MWGSGWLNAGDSSAEGPLYVSTPKQIWKDARAIAAGNHFTLMITRDGDLYGFGNNQYGNLGLGYDTDYENEPMLLVEDVAMAAAGFEHALIVRGHGAIFGFGHNQFGKLGTGAVDRMPDRHRPVRVELRGEL